MNYDFAVRLFSEIDTINLEDEKFKLLKAEMFRAILNYARLRADFYFLTYEERVSKNQFRTLTHNALIEALDKLAAYLKEVKNFETSWREEMGNDRKNIGDFACHVHAYLGILMR